MSTIPESQQALELEIAKLEQDLASLKRRRNALSAISQLPTELMHRIFHLSIRYPDEARGRDWTPLLNLEDTRRSISHVSHDWRTIALEWPKLWSEIHIKNTPKVEYLDLIRERARGIPLSLMTHWITHSTVPAVRHVFQTEGARLKSVALLDPVSVLRDLLPELKACSNTIEFLELDNLASHPLSPPDLTETDALYNFPKLRHLRISAWETLVLPPLSSNSTSLTSLELFFLRFPSTRVTDALFGTLRNVAHHLSSLTLSFMLPSNLQSGSLTTAGMLPIEMPCIKDISLISNRQDILPALSSVLLVPSSVRRVLIAARQGGSSQDVSSSLQHICTNIPSPKFLQLNHRFAPGDGTYSMCTYALKATPLNPQNAVGLNPDNVTIRLLPSPYPHAFPASLVNPDGWLFSALLRIVLTCPSPAPFWKALALVPTLEVIEHLITHSDDAFCRTLEEAVEADQVGLAEDGKCFPALVAIGTTFHRKDLSWDVEYAERLAIALLHKLRRKGTPYFAWLDFYGCRSHIDADTLRLLFSVSREVWWTVATP
ncbi:hypothetical protein DFP72DRAFT_925553 [Ephemerocybe angulata]|uniref:F-box domain-containing protein n=1 Tax=Ephemerocybe angulata TaxID=980116 RepID=A0A8H6HFP0_9AGAR|nr:hypothetical protein DFP72DRAFT_925553 [Tulosesus angulatus]